MGVAAYARSAAAVGSEFVLNIVSYAGESARAEAVSTQSISK